MSALQDRTPKQIAALMYIRRQAAATAQIEADREWSEQIRQEKLLEDALDIQAEMITDEPEDE